MTVKAHALARPLTVLLLAVFTVALLPVTAPPDTACTAVAAEAPQRFSMEFREADLRDVLRLLAQESGMNLLLGEKIGGRITVSFREVTLQEALDAILKSYGYSYSVVGNIVTIDTAPAKKKLVTRTVPIHYSTDVSGDTDLTNLAEGLKPVLSGVEGSGVSVVSRTNTLVITDIPENVDKVVALAKNLDRHTPQVKIEARIVEVKDIDQDELGIQWGGRFTADSAHGNALPVNFPNSLTIAGTQDAEEGNFLVNLPVARPVAGIGLTMGHIANTFSLDLQLSAMEKLEKLKILSTPTVLAVQNREAVIKVGEQIPVETRTADSAGITTTEVEFKDVVLQLKVVPYVIPDGKIFLSVSINKDTRGEEVILSDGSSEFAIDTKVVSTRVLLNDGETAVIGGLHSQTEIDTQTRVPVLHRIPGLGWLFRSQARDDTRNELMVFLTPRIQAP